MKVRIAAVQYQLRKINCFEDFEQQIQFVLSSASEYKPQFVLFPELFTTQLLSFIQTSDIYNAVRKLDAYTEKYINLFRSYAEQYKFISLPEPIQISAKIKFIIRHFYLLQPVRFIHRTKYIVQDGKKNCGMLHPVMSSKFSKLSFALYQY